MQLFSYNMIERKRQIMEERYKTYFNTNKEVRPKKIVMKKLKGYFFEEEKEGFNSYIQFSQEINFDNMKLDHHTKSSDHAFLSNFYVIKQLYNKQKSRQEIEQQNKNALERKKLEDAGEDVPEELKEKVEDHDNEFTIYNFAYE